MNVNPLIAIIVLTFIVVVIIGGLEALARFVSIKFNSLKEKKSSYKNMAYECGVEGVSGPTSRVSSGFYLTAILFVLFDIEIIFLYPWAVSYRDFIKDGLGGQSLIALIIFLLFFVIGLFWEIRAQALKWK